MAHLRVTHSEPLYPPYDRVSLEILILRLFGTKLAAICQLQFRFFLPQHWVGVCPVSSPL